MLTGHTKSIQPRPPTDRPPGARSAPGRVPSQLGPSVRQGQNGSCNADHDHSQRVREERVHAPLEARVAQHPRHGRGDGPQGRPGGLPRRRGRHSHHAPRPAGHGPLHAVASAAGTRAGSKVPGFHAAVTACREARNTPAGRTGRWIRRRRRTREGKAAAE